VLGFYGGNGNANRKTDKQAEQTLFVCLFICLNLCVNNRSHPRSKQPKLIELYKVQKNASSGGGGMVRSKTDVPRANNLQEVLQCQ
jgi:hypothetical protein